MNSTPKRHYFRGTFTSDDIIGNEQLKFNLNGKGNNNFLFCFVVITVSYDDVSLRVKWDIGWQLRLDTTDVMQLSLFIFLIALGEALRIMLK